MMVVVVVVVVVEAEEEENDDDGEDEDGGNEDDDDDDNDDDDTVQTFSSHPFCDNDDNYRNNMSRDDEESVAHGDRDRSRKPWFSTIERGHHMDGCPFIVRLFAPTVGDFSRSQHSTDPVQNFVQALYPTKVLRMEL